MRVLSKDDVTNILQNLSESELQRLLDSLHDVLQQYTKNRDLPQEESTIHQPEREVFTTKVGNTSLFMPSSLTTVTGIKVVTLAKDSTTPVGSINIFEPTGELRGVLDAADITAFRTALAVMILYSRFTQADQHIVVFGAGKQAEWHVRLALQLQPGRVRSVTIVNRRKRSSAEELITELQQKYQDVEFQLLINDGESEADRLREYLSRSDVVFCCTPSTEPLFTFKDLGEKQRSRYFGMIGSYKPHMQEIDRETLLSGGHIYVDSKPACLKEAGEIIIGEVPEDHLIEVGEVSNELKLDTDKNVVFKCVGLGIMDIAVSAVLLEMATSKKLGTVIEM